ncbi:MAG: substrate-binding domain-containing protein [Chloroflexota bacterium]
MLATALLATALLATMVLTTSRVAADEPRLVLGTTVGLQQSGLLDVLIPPFERQRSRAVTVVAVSAPQALALGVRGELDALLVDAAEDEGVFVAAGHGVERRLVFHADDVVLGPPSDPAHVRDARGVGDALRRVAQAQQGWVSRADNSGLYQLEKKLWRDAGVEPLGQAWYQALGQGMQATLAAATERQAYTLADRQAFLERRDHLDLAVVSEGDPDLLRLYHIILVNPARGEWIDAPDARAFAEYLLGAEAQATIAAFGVDRFGQAIFTADAGRTERELVPGS